jgi:glycerol-3-phosphate acyltransferase PlsY
MLIILSAYLIGSVPFALILGRVWGVADLRVVGSGNLGAANLLRVSGVTPGILVALLDAGKGAASVLLAQRWQGPADLSAAAGVAAVIGHVYPVWAGFRGGKGVATSAGVFAILAPAASLAAFLIFVVTAWATRFVSVGSLAASVLLPPLAYITGRPMSVVGAGGIVAAVILVRHRTNLIRLRRGVERRLGR